MSHDRSGSRAVAGYRLKHQGQRVGILQPPGGLGSTHVPGTVVWGYLSQYGNMAICVCVCVFKCFWDRIYAPWKVDGVIPPPAKIESIKARKSRRDLMCNGGHILILGPFWIVLVEWEWDESGNKVSACRNLEGGWALLPLGHEAREIFDSRGNPTVEAGDEGDERCTCTWTH